MRSILHHSLGLFAAAALAPHTDMGSGRITTGATFAPHTDGTGGFTTPRATFAAEGGHGTGTEIVGATDVATDPHRTDEPRVATVAGADVDPGSATKTTVTQ